MKYIRTKDDEIIEIEDYDKEHGCYYFYDIGCIQIYEEDVVKTADTIEELCDYYVVFDDEGHCSITRDYSYFLEMYIELKRHNFLDEAYGIIKTSKGLIYVAKMNDKGELELL